MSIADPIREPPFVASRPIEGSVFEIGTMAAFAQELAHNGDHEEASKYLGSQNAEAIDEVSARIIEELHRYHSKER